jgi:hypothetical protein
MRSELSTFTREDELCHYCLSVMGHEKALSQTGSQAQSISVAIGLQLPKRQQCLVELKQYIEQ